MRPVQYAGTIDHNLVQFPLMMFPKPNGVFGTFYKGAIYTREGNRVINELLQETFSDVAKKCDGLEFEIDFPLSDFNILSGAVRSKEHPRTLDIVLKCFDYYAEYVPAIGRQATVRRLVKEAGRKDMQFIPYDMVTNISELLLVLDSYYTEGLEGAVYRAPHSFYKGDGRSTINEASFLREKFEKFFGGYIVEVHESIDKHGNPKGMAHSATVIVPEVGGTKVTVSLTRNLTDSDRKAIWENRNLYPGRWLDFTTNAFEGMDFRSPIFLEWRDDKNAGLKV